MAKSLDSVLIKPSGPDCNLNCTYCFYLDKSGLYPKTAAHRMSIEVLEEMIRQLMTQSGSYISITWQGGEPALLGLEFYKKAVEFQEKYGKDKTVANGFQTNGLLLNENWAEFFVKYNFLIGLSIDGPKHIHDHYRKSNNDSGSWETVYKNARTLLRMGVEVNALSCVTDYSAGYAEEIYKFHRELGIRWMQFIPIVESDKNDPNKASDFSVTAEAYGEFLCELFDLWRADFKEGSPTTSVRYFDSVFYHYVGIDPPDCTLKTECGVYVVIEHNGDVYSCDFFVEPNWKLGNIMNRKIISMLNSKKQDQFGKIKSKPDVKCIHCQWLRYCRGGCTKDRIKDPRDKGISHFCDGYKMFFGYADSYFKQLASEWKKSNKFES